MTDLKVTPGTIVRTVVLVLALINQLLTALGKSPLPISSEELTSVLSTVFTMAAAVWAWWKNNSFTKPALEADVVLENIKADGGKLDAE